MIRTGTGLLIAMAIVTAVLATRGREGFAQVATPTATPTTTTSSPAPFVPNPVYGPGGYAMVVFMGNDIEVLKSSANAAGASGVWVQDRTGTFQLLPVVADAPAFLQGAFQAAVPSVRGPLAVTLVRPTPVSPAVITLDMNQSTVALRVGDRVLLALGETYSWSPTVADTSVLRRVPNVTVARGAQGLYEAAAVGSTDLSATGAPVCAVNQPCPAIAAIFRVHVVVVP